MNPDNPSFRTDESIEREKSLQKRYDRLQAQADKLAEALEFVANHNEAQCGPMRIKAEQALKEYRGEK